MDLVDAARAPPWAAIVLLHKEFYSPSVRELSAPCYRSPGSSGAAEERVSLGYVPRWVIYSATPVSLAPRSCSELPPSKVSRAMERRDLLVLVLPHATERRTGQVFELNK